MIHINNRSDFSIVWKMPNGGILPTFPYTLEFNTRGGLRYAVKSDDATRFIPKPDADGQIRSAVIVFDFSNRPHLPSGRLSFTMKAAIPNTMYPDDYQDITEPHPTNAELWDGATDYKDAIEVELVLPYVKGDKGDAGDGVPAGGRTGQVLKKKSDGDYDTEWSEDEGITDIAPGAVGTEEIADNAVTELKLAKGVRDNINGKLNKTETSTEPTASTVIRRDNNGRAKVATPEADDDIANKQYVDAQKIKEPGKAGNFVVLDANGMPTPSDYKPASFRKASDKIKTDDIAEKAVTESNLSDGIQDKLKAADGAVRFDEAQELTPAQQEQVSNNVGVPTVFLRKSELNIVLSDERAAQIASAMEIVLIGGVNELGQSYLRAWESDAQIHFDKLYDYDRLLRLKFEKQTNKITYGSSYLSDPNAVKFNSRQTLTSTQQLQARTNIAAMANTPSGDPMHYIYETAGAEWIPYADISTDGLEDWQVETLDRAQAQADGGVWWHNGIFVTVEQNRINYVYTIGEYPANTPNYQYYLCNIPITTNYKQLKSVSDPRSLNASIRRCENIVSAVLPNLDLNMLAHSFSYCPKLVKVTGIFTVSRLSAVNSSFLDATDLRDISLRGLNANIDLSGAPNLSMTSIRYAVTNAGTATLTITLAPAVYAAAMADADVQAALTSKPNVTLADAGASSSGAN